MKKYIVIFASRFKFSYIIISALACFLCPALLISNSFKDHELYIYDFLKKLDQVINTDKLDKEITIYQVEEENISSNNFIDLTNKLLRYEPIVIGFMPTEKFFKEDPESYITSAIQLLKTRRETDNSEVIKSLQDILPEVSESSAAFDDDISKLVLSTKENLYIKNRFIDISKKHKSELLITDGNILLDDTKTSKLTDVRRYLLFHALGSSQKFSLGLKLAEKFLERNFSIENGIIDKFAIRFESKNKDFSVEIPRLEKSIGIYNSYYFPQGITVTTLINNRCPEISFLDLFKERKCINPFNTRKISSIRNFKFENEYSNIKDKIIIITFSTDDIDEAVIHAHATSQIINAVSNNRKLYKTFSNTNLYLILFLVSIISCISIGPDSFIIESKIKRLLIILFLSNLFFTLIFIGTGFWFAMILKNITIIFASFGIICESKFNNIVDQIFEKSRLESIELTFKRLHSRPLQDLFILRRELDKGSNINIDLLKNGLTQIDKEIRDIFDDVRRSSNLISNKNLLVLRNGTIHEFRKLHVHELLYLVFNDLVKQDTRLSELIPIRDFDDFDDSSFSNASKFIIYEIFEEALINVAKHATGAKLVKARGKLYDNRYYKITVIDDGPGSEDNFEKTQTILRKYIFSRNAQKINGEFMYENIIEEDKITGACFSFIFPVRQNYKGNSGIFNRFLNTILKKL